MLKLTLAKTLILSLFFVASLVSAHNDKQAFIDFMLPAIRKAQYQILAQRQLIEHYYQQCSKTKHLLPAQMARLNQLNVEYKLPTITRCSDSNWKILLRRIDIIPASLALAQAIHESGWGRSRFAQEGHNYFGQWCYEAGCGMVPFKRSAQARFEVRKFESVYQSVKHYMYNLNTHDAYLKLRIMRSTLRAHDSKSLGIQLAQALESYSQKKETYGVKITNIIEQNNLDEFEMRHRTLS